MCFAICHYNITRSSTIKTNKKNIKNKIWSEIYIFFVLFLWNKYRKSNFVIKMHTDTHTHIYGPFQTNNLWSVANVMTWRYKYYLFSILRRMVNWFLFSSSSSSDFLFLIYLPTSLATQRCDCYRSSCA